MDPQQELFSALLLELKKQYPDGVYDTFLPPEGTPYPFIYLADSDLNDRANKTAVFGTVSQTIRGSAAQFHRCFCRSSRFADIWNIPATFPGPCRA